MNAEAAAPAAAFAVRSLHKSYGGVPVLQGVDLDVRPGEIHALLGANGAGKSTLIKCIAGVTQPDSGAIEIGGSSYAQLSPSSSRAAGVAVIYQELSVAPTLSVTANVFLGNERRFGPFVRHRAQAREAKRALADLGMDLDLARPLGSYGAAESQVVEIVKALRSEPRVLILDEPTASLTQKEAEQLADKMRALRAQGVPLLFVTHRLDEVFALADRVSILRAGKIVLSKATRDCTPRELVTAIVGRDPETLARTGAAASTGTPPLLAVRDLVGPDLGPLDLDVFPGEVLGLYGLVGSGRTELLESLFGARLTVRGQIVLDGKELRLSGPGAAIGVGIALVPSDRKRKGIIGELSAQANVILSSGRALGRAGFRRRAAEGRSFRSVAADLDLRPMSPRLEGRRFSGGNQQKLVVGRWLQPELGCRILLLDEPTQGVDVGARADLYRAVRAFVGTERAAIVASSEPTELQQLADRVIVLSRGRVATTLPVAEATEHRLIELAHLSEIPGGTP
ncbi:sugar ABC transporter ATP-binding protein [Sinomonas sp. ASV322]|uniref:sugar ABC transporter ATP-binding protein n=1 Tax=Sinomonas sp. ASV322 TaxID=3041920 RepID=UPI0027DBB032|nr:sugar ABC transporter ATP-binding protein [Sinomonas sp. ASV322]MDQ4501794.1 sugar ABC transporter ATP-binding protein [Sinomonas sp. ASV322]